MIGLQICLFISQHLIVRVMNGSLCNDTHLVAKDLLKLNNPVDTCFISSNIIL